MAFSRRQAQNGNLLKMGGASLFVHVAMVFFLSLSPLPRIIQTRPTPYTVTLMPISVQEPEIQKSSPPPVVKEEKPKPIEKPKKDDLVEKVKPLKKVELKHLQEAIDEIRKKVALDEIQKRVARREKTEERITPVAPVAPVSPPVPIVSSPQTSLGRESKLKEYCGMIWAKIKEEWTIPENLLKEKEMVDIETIIVIIIERNGKIQKSWFEKKSGNAIYDQSAMRALMKAEPFPPIPKELNEKTLEIGIRFFPD
jgi:colicin import membrane protein